MSTVNQLTVTEIQRFCMHDGPGIRTTVFLKGCPLRCEWCHNPETQLGRPELLFYANKCIACKLCESNCPVGVHSFDGKHTIDREACTACGKCEKCCPTGAVELCGKKYGADEIIREIEKDRAFFGNLGGMTLSGGEPLMQGTGAVNLLKMAKQCRISTAVETSGYVDEEILLSAIEHSDLFLYDIKDTDGERHKKYTGVSNEKILRNLTLIDENGAKTRLRCILINGINTNEEHFRRVAELALSLKNCEGVEWIPYHAYGGTKSTFIGREDSGRKYWIPTLPQTENAKSAVRSKGVKVF